MREYLAEICAQVLETSRGEKKAEKNGARRSFRQAEKRIEGVSGGGMRAQVRKASTFALALLVLPRSASYAHNVCGRMRTYADVCGRMLTYAGARAPSS